MSAAIYWILTENVATAEPRSENILSRYRHWSKWFRVESTVKREDEEFFLDVDSPQAHQAYRKQQDGTNDAAYSECRGCVVVAARALS